MASGGADDADLAAIRARLRDSFRRDALPPEETAARNRTHRATAPPSTDPDRKRPRVALNELARRYMPPEEPPARLAPTERDARILRHSFGDRAAPPQASVVTAHHYQIPGWWNQLLDSVALQRGLRAWELVEVQNFDNAFSVGEALNLAVANARSGWCWFVGDDDYVHPDGLRVLLRHAALHGADLVQCGGVVVDAEGEPMSHGPGSLGFVRVEAFHDVGGFKRLRLMEDEEFLVRFLNAGKRPVRIPAPLYWYRAWEGQVTTPVKREGGAYALMTSKGYATSPAAAPATAQRAEPPAGPDSPPRA